MTPANFVQMVAKIDAMPLPPEDAQAHLHLVTVMARKMLEQPAQPRQFVPSFDPGSVAGVV